MSMKQLLAALMLLSLMLPASGALADLHGAAGGPMRKETVQDVPNAEAIRRMLQQFDVAKLSLAEAIEIAERLHDGSRAAAAAFESSDAAGYRIITVKHGQAWENLIDANTGRVIGPEMASSLDQFADDERSNIVALRSVVQELTDAVHVAEKAASGKAFGVGLIRDEGKLSFFVVVLSDGEFKEVRLEPPKAGRKGSSRYRLR
jgi:uncharacterized membrane protein YkoI